MFFETERLNEAFDDVATLTAGGSLADYLKGEISAIEDLSKFFTSEAFDTLLSQDPAMLENQIALLAELEERTGQTFEAGSRAALDFLESIELVAEAIANSRENIEEWRRRNETAIHL